VPFRELTFAFRELTFAFRELTFLRKVSKIEILLAQELVAKIGHESGSWAGSKGRTPSGRETTRRCASGKDRPSIRR
jgi:hypothetical protein